MMTFAGLDVLVGEPASARAATIDGAPHGGLSAIRYKIENALAATRPGKEEKVMGQMLTAALAAYAREAVDDSASAAGRSLPRITVHLKIRDKAHLSLRSKLEVVLHGTVLEERESTTLRIDHKDTRDHLERIVKKSHEWLVAHGL
jgi:hypothetical protein